MQERQVTIGETTYPLADPFLVLATQNPLEQEGTYQLPEAQLDRFMLKLRVGYPSKAEERRILDLMATSTPDLKVLTITEPADIIRSREIVNSIYVDDRVKDYIVDVVFATREPASYRLPLDGMIRYGASPRATIALTLAARARAFIAGRGYVTPQDVKSVGHDVLRHRIIVSYEAEAEGMTSEQVIEKIFAGLAVP
jgi:MoxR-like ATPase